ncbi:MAG: cytidine deaminase [Dehalococcoidia bacterium]|nr:cytidine deaminase [Dehalococcoidia bacterium]
MKARLYRKDWHAVGSALRTRSGRVFSAVHLEAYVGRMAVCAEAIALGIAVKEGDSGVDTVVAVSSSGEIMAPCGMCRELISDYSPEARVIVPGDGGAEVVGVMDLLPSKVPPSQWDVSSVLRQARQGLHLTIHVGQVRQQPEDQAVFINNYRRASPLGRVGQIPFISGL